MKQSMDSKEPVFLTFYDNDKYFSSKFTNGFLEDAAGGWTENRNSIALSKDLSKSVVNGNNTNNWTIGMQAMHELIFHIHPQGQKDGTANVMREWYGQRTKGRNPRHGPGIGNVNKKLKYD